MSTRPLACLITAAALLAGAAGAAAAAAPPLTVVATTTQLQDLVRNVGGARVRVVGILRPNVDPHEYEPTPGDAAAIAGARLVVTSGVGLDSRMDRLIRGVGSRAALLVASQGLPIRRGDAQEPLGDPHWWHDPRLFARAAEAVGAALQRIDPAGRAVYAAATRRYLARLLRLDRELAAEVARVPPAQRKLVTNHDAFGYLAARYGLTIVGTVVPSLSTAAEPSARDIARLIDRIRAERVRAIFTESSIDPRIEDQIARDAGARVLASLYGDTLGPPGSPGATYVGMMRWNVASIVAGLLGEPQPRP